MDLSPNHGVRQCGTCRYALPNPNDGKSLLCRRYPPTVLLIPQMHQSLHPQTKQLVNQQAMIPQSVPPPVTAEWTCGEHQFQTEANLQ